jgi:DNA-binding NarL/FixJ family response regulator
MQTLSTATPAAGAFRGPIRLLVVDDHAVVRKAVCRLLATEPDFIVVGEAADGGDAVSRCEELSPDVVVMDVALPGLDGVEATRQVLARKPAPRVVALSALTDPRTVNKCLHAGAAGYVSKVESFRDLAAAIREAHRGGTYVSPGLASAVPAAPGGRPTAGARAHGLTVRQREIVRLMAAGRATKEIARDLSVSVKTVETHRRHILEKTGAEGVADVTRFALREGLASL